MQDIKKSYHNAFEKIGKTYQNRQIWPFLDLSDLSKILSIFWQYISTLLVKLPA